MTILRPDAQPTNIRRLVLLSLIATGIAFTNSVNAADDNPATLYGDEAVAADWAFHNAVLGAADQVVAQFGKDSNEIQALGYKKKSEYKSPSKPAPAAPKTP